MIRQVPVRESAQAWYASDDLVALRFTGLALAVLANKHAPVLLILDLQSAATIGVRVKTIFPAVQSIALNLKPTTFQTALLLAANLILSQGGHGPVIEGSADSDTAEVYYRDSEADANVNAFIERNWTRIESELGRGITKWRPTRVTGDRLDRVAEKLRRENIDLTE
jgi:succinate dehydrogenase hydrophobic anchor subunit